MDENNEKLNQEDLEEMFEMEELTELEEKELTGGGSAGYRGYSIFIVDLNTIYPPMDPRNVRTKVIYAEGGAECLFSKFSDGRIKVAVKSSQFKHMPRIKFEVNYTGRDSRYHCAQYEILPTGRIKYISGWTGM